MKNIIFLLFPAVCFSQTIKTDLVFTAGAAATLINKNIVDGENAFKAQSVVNKTIQFDYPAAKVIPVLSFYEDARAYTQGTWKWQFYNSGSKQWIDLGSPFVLGGSVIQTINLSYNSNTGYTQYRLFGLSGSTNEHVWIREIALTAVDPVTTIPPTTPPTSTKYCCNTAQVDSIKNVILGSVVDFTLRISGTDTVAVIQFPNLRVKFKATKD